MTALEKEERVTTFLFTFQAVSRISGTIMTASFPMHSRPESSTSQNKPWAERSPYILLLNFLFFKPLQMTNSSQPETLDKELDRVGKRKREAERERRKGEKGAIGTSICSDPSPCYLPVCRRLNNYTSPSPVYSPTMFIMFTTRAILQATPTRSSELLLTFYSFHSMCFFFKQATPGFPFFGLHW